MPTQRVPPLYYFEISMGRQCIQILKGEPAPKKYPIFRSTISKKCPKKRFFFGLYLKKIWPKQDLFSALAELGKKRGNPRSAPDCKPGDDGRLL